MDINKVKDEVTKLVEDILSKKAEAGIQADVEEALRAAEKSITDLVNRVAEVEAQSAVNAGTIEELEGSKAQLESELAAKTEELEAAKKLGEELLHRAQAAEGTLETMEKDKLVADRMSELDGLRVARAGEAREKQVELVRAMSDDSFAAYKEEMVALREELVASIKEELASSGTNNTEAGSADDSEGVVTPPADVASALETASTTLPNLETSSTNNRWKNFGEGLANYIKSQRGEASKDKR